MKDQMKVFLGFWSPACWAQCKSRRLVLVPAGWLCRELCRFTFAVGLRALVFKKWGVWSQWGRLRCLSRVLPAAVQLFLFNFCFIVFHKSKYLDTGFLNLLNWLVTHCDSGFHVLWYWSDDQAKIDRTNVRLKKMVIKHVHVFLLSHKENFGCWPWQ